MNNDATAVINREGTQAYPMDAALASAAEACPACSTQIPSGEQFCPRCGYQRGTWAAGPAAGTAAAPASTATAPAEGSAQLRSGADPALAPYFLENAHGQQFGLALGETVIGRGEVDIQLNDSFASRRHARFVVSADSVMVEDLGSSNGTFIEEAQLAAGIAMPLSHGEKLKVGGTVLTLHRNDKAAGAETAPLEISPAPPLLEDDSAGPDATQSLSSDAAAPTDAVTDETAVDGGAPAQAEAEAGSAELSEWGLQFAEGAPQRLKYGSTTFGRKAEKAELVVGDSYVSSLHGQFDASADALSITDLGSTNGTLVNEERLSPHQPHPLAAGDVITLGQTQIVVSLED
ncbi:FHA domain-containing protein [bacterium]|nr:FHA domain-containing protein [bacterium]